MCEVKNNMPWNISEKVPKKFFASFVETMSDWQKTEVG